MAERGTEGRKQINLDVDAELHRQLKMRAAALGITLAATSEKALADGIAALDVTPEEAATLAKHGFESRVVWVRPSGIDSSAKYTKREALKACIVPSEKK
jgi:hypothetical protein